MNISKKSLNYHVGKTSPSNKDDIWFDTRDNEVNITLPQSIIFELKEVITSQKKSIEDLQTKVDYLMRYISNQNSGEYENAFLLENGNVLLLENGNYLKLEF